MRRILILTFLILPCIYAAAQQYPVQVTPQLLPPYTLQVSDYYSPGPAGSKLNLLLLLRDFNKPTLQVRLRMSIEGQSVTLRTKDDAVFDPITLESGVPKYLDPLELQEYFNSNKLDFSGMTQQQYETTGKLPEGLYTFCFEVIESGTNLVVSNKGCSMAWMTLSEPPMLNIPRKAEALVPVTPQNIIFQWTPRHTSSPTASFNIEYIFSIVELLDEAIAPEAAFLSNPPLFTDSTNLTIYLFDASKPALIPGKKYAWRVQARAKSGLQDMAMFRNNGFSETFWFTYQNNCAIPVGIGADPQGQRVNITWTNNADHIDYRVEYREKNNPAAVWFEIGNSIPRVSIGDLKFSTVYEYRVGGACEYGKFIFSPLDQFTTNDSLSTTVANCGVDPNLVATTAPLLTSMNAGDTIKAGDFNVITTQVSGQSSFSGEGYVAVSWLGNMKIGVRFTNIGVATDKKLKTGVIETTYDPTESGIESIDEVIEDVRQFFTDFFGDHWNQFSLTNYDGTISGASRNPDGTVTVSGSGGQTILPAGKNYIITDNTGNTYYVSAGGEITQAEGPKGQPVGSPNPMGEPGSTTSISPDMPLVKFSKTGQTKYAIDVADEFIQTGGKRYEQLSTGGTPYFVNWKLLQTGQDEFLTATLTEGTANISLDSIRFKRTDGTIIPATRTGNTWQIMVRGRLNLYTDALWAVVNKWPGTDTVTEKILGKINLVNVDKIKRTVVIVPVNGQGESTDVSQAEQRLNDIYKPFAVEWKLIKKPNLVLTAYDTTSALKVERRFLNLSYGPELRSIIDGYGRNFDDTSVFFMVNKPDLEDVRGYMALSNKYGFLFQRGNVQADGKVMAHELGHGVFDLLHVFGDNDADQGKTLNLMDYAGPEDNALFMEQWKQIHDSKLKIRFGQDAEDGSLATLNNMELLKEFRVNGKYTFLSPAGKMITLPGNISSVSFTTGDVWRKENCSIKSFKVVAFGALASFRLGDTTFSVRRICNTTAILGYRNSVDTTRFFKEYDTYVNPPAKVIVGVPVLLNGSIDFAVGRIAVPNTVPVSAENSGEGTEQPYDFLFFNLANLYANPDSVKFIYASLQPDLRNSPEAMKFLLANADYAKFGQNTGLYVFAHAYQIANFPDAFNNPCGVLYDRVRDEDPYEYQHQLPADNTTVVHTITYTESPEEWLKNTFIRWQTMKLSRYEELVNDMEVINRLTSITDPSLLQDTLENFNENECVWKGMNIANRLHALKTLLMSNNVNGSWLGLANNREYYVLKLLRTVTKQEEQFAIVDMLQENRYALLFRAFDKMNGDNLDGFMNILTRFIKARYPVDKDEFFKGNTPSIENPTNVSLPSQFLSLWNKHDGALKKTSFDGTLYEAQGLIKIDNSNYFYNTQNAGSWYGSQHHWVDSPYANIGLIFKENFEYSTVDGKGNIDEEDKAVVPMIWAYWFQHRYNSDQGLHDLRVALDILGAIVSGGTAKVALRAIEISFAVTDAIITINRNNIIAEFGSEGSEFLSTWDNIGAVVGGILITRGIVTYSTSGKFGLALNKIKTAYKEVKSNTAELFKFKQNLQALAAGMKNLVTTAGDKIANLQNMYNRLVDEISWIYLQEKFRAVAQNVSLSVRNTTYAILVSGNIEIQIATGEYLNNMFRLKGGMQWLNTGQVGRIVGTLEQVGYVRNGVDKVGDLAIIFFEGKYYFRQIDHLRYLGQTETIRESLKLLRDNNLIQNIGSASDLEIAAIHRYTVNSDFLNGPMRTNDEVNIIPFMFDEYAAATYTAIVDGIAKMRETSRLYQNVVWRGRAYTKADFDALFMSGRKEIPLKGFVSCSTDESVADMWLTKNASAEKPYNVKFQIESKNGVSIDDISDFGETLFPKRHTLPDEFRQYEVLLEEGYYRVIGQPTLISETNGIKTFKITLEETGKPLRTIK